MSRASDWLSARWWIWRHPFKKAAIKRYLNRGDGAR